MMKFDVTFRWWTEHTQGPDGLKFSGYELLYVDSPVTSKSYLEKIIRQKYFFVDNIEIKEHEDELDKP